ncbi:MAG: GNAT family N-acetyltransferase [Pirellulaceae bacterium]
MLLVLADGSTCFAARVITYRSFLNTDLPGIVQVWKQQRRQPAFAQTMFNDQFERSILSKPFFDPAGLIMALRDEEAVGFAHCGFGPNEDRTDLNYERGIICLLLTTSSPDRLEICSQLIERAEQYLVSRGSKTILTGTDFPFSPFYLGLYGGSNVPGILRANEATIQVFESRGYNQLSRILIMQRSLHDFRAVMDRQQTTVRRSFRIEQDQDPLAADWWEACTLGNTNRCVFNLIDRKTNENHGNISYWDMEPLARNWGVRAMGLFSLKIESQARQAGLGTFLVGESLRHMQQQAINLVEAQVADDNLAAVNLFEKMGFEANDFGIVLGRDF